MEQAETGLVAATDGWFVVNVNEAAWVTSEKFGAACIFEGNAAPFGQIGYTLAVLAPGQANGMYHREDEPGGLPCAVRRVSPDRRGRGAPPAGVGLRSLPARYRQEHDGGQEVAFT